MKRTYKTQPGIAHLGLIALVVVVVGVIGFAGWRVMNNKDKKDSATSTTLSSSDAKAAQAECEKDNDKDICKFYVSWKDHKQYRMTSTDASGAKSVFEVDGTKSHIKTSGDVEYEVITIDKTNYTKAGSTWYKQTIKTSDQDVSADYKEDFKEPDQDTTASPDKTVYKKITKEACGSLTCFKYEVIDSSAPDEKQFIWFDDKDYQLRKSRTENKDGVSEQTFEYTNVSISAPSPVKELGANQYIVPGQTEPMELPTGVGQ